MEGGGRWAVDELMDAAAHKPIKERRGHAKQNPRNEPHGEDNPPTDKAPAREPPANAPKERYDIEQLPSRTPNERRTAIRTRTNVRAVKALGKALAPKLRPTTPQAVAKQATSKAQQATQQHTRHMVAKAQQAAKAAARATKRVAIAMVKPVAALVSSLVGLLGGGFLLIALVIVIVIAAVANSPFGLFFAVEPNAPDTVSVATVNVAYNAKLEALQAGDNDSIVIHGQAPDWPDVLAVFAVKLAGADAGGLDVATLDAARVGKLTAVFWDMTIITTWVEEIYHPGSGEDDPGWTEYILHITITPKTAYDMRTASRIGAVDKSPTTSKPSNMV